MAYTLLTASEVAQLLRLKTDSVYRLIQTDGLPAVKIGGQWRFEEARVHDWIASQFKGVAPARRTSPNLAPHVPEPNALPTCGEQPHV